MPEARELVSFRLFIKSVADAGCSTQKAGPSTDSGVLLALYLLVIGSRCTSRQLARAEITYSSKEPRV